MKKKILILGGILVAGIVVFLSKQSPDQASATSGKLAPEDSRVEPPSGTTETGEELARSRLERAPSSPGSALREVMGIRDADERNARLVQLLESLGPEALSELRDAFEQGFRDSLFLREWEHFLKWWAKFSPEDALIYANSGLQDDTWEAKHLAAAALAEDWLSRDPDAAAYFLYQLPPGEVRDNTTMALGQEYVIQDLEKALAWGDANPDPTFRSSALHSIAFGALRRGMHDGFEPATIEATAAWLRTHAHEPYAAEALALWVGEVVREDSEQAAGWIDWVIDLPGGIARDRALNSFFTNASHTSPETLENWLTQIDGRSSLDEALAGYVRGSGLAKVDDPTELDLLEKLANNIGNAPLREGALKDIADLRTTLSPEPPEQ